MPRKLLLIDGHSLVYRAYHALPPLSTSDGKPTNAVFGMAQMLIGLLEQEQPDAVLVAFDTAAPTHRHEELEAYKANRAPMPDDLVAQQDLIHELVAAMGLALAELPGFEADDIIGSLAHRAVEQGYEAVAVSGDRDLLQFVQPGVKVLITLKGIKDTKLYDEAAVREEYGVNPPQFADMKGLSGDTSDNIPGVPGVGWKTAQKLVEQFGSVDGVYQHLDEIKGKLGETLRVHEEQARLSRRLATIDFDAPVPVTVEQCRWEGMNAQALRRFLGRLEFTSLLERIPGAQEQHDLDIRLPENDADVAAACADLRASGEVWIAGGGGLTAAAKPGERLAGLALAGPEGACYYFPIGEDAADDGGLFAEMAPPRLPAPVTALLADACVPKSGIGLKDLSAAMRKLDIELTGFGFDAAIASYLLAPHRNDHSLTFLAAQCLGREVPPATTAGPAGIPAQANVTAVSVDLLRSLKHPLLRDLAGAGLQALFDEMEMPLVGVLNDMERAGIAVDTTALQTLGDKLNSNITYLRERILELAGEAFNPDSTQQLAVILFDKLELPRGKRTKTGWSTNADVLEALADDYEIVRKVLEYREYTKLRSTYVEGLLREIDPKTGRIHTTFEQTVAATGRLSSRAPNLQNIPVRTEIGREIRACFTSGGPELTLISADYSQIELRVMAHMSEDPYLVEAFQAGEDVHQRTAAAIFEVPADDVTYDMRRVAKTVNYAVIYGMGSQALAKQIGITKDQAQQFIDNYFRRLGGVAAFLEKTVAEARAMGYVTTLRGRRRPIPDINSSMGGVRAYAERAAGNTPLQGTAADIIKTAMVSIAHGLPGICRGARMLLQVHDELVFEAPLVHVSEVAGYVKGVMETAVTLSVPITVDVAVGPNWRDMTPLTS